MVENNACYRDNFEYLEDICDYLSADVRIAEADTCRDRKGNCYAMPEIEAADIEGIEKLFTSLVFKMLLAEGMISAELVENMRSWKHSGFSVHCGTPIQADETDSRKTLSEYISRAPFSLERMSFNEGSDTVL
ncbi:MAG: hypothetical protein GQ565_06540 [Candidatus Aegiribacteria sp.]|nr:hypothetical protein [Candidatus Aegiribacteria sp.]